jgi:hypothetical protein
MSTRSHPSRSNTSLAPPRHYMGNHPLFQSAATAKRFPVLANVPQDELASMFRVATVDRNQERLDELVFHEPHRDRMPLLRPHFKSKHASAVAFRPSNSRAAKAAIANTSPSVFTGFDAEVDDYNTRAVSRGEQHRRNMTEQPFSCGTKAEAAKGIERTTYLNSLDEDALEAMRRMTREHSRRRQHEADGFNNTMVSSAGSGLNASRTTIASRGGNRKY